MSNSTTPQRSGRSRVYSTLHADRTSFQSTSGGHRISLVPSEPFQTFTPAQDDLPPRPRQLLHKKNASLVVPTSPRGSILLSPSSPGSRLSLFQPLIVKPPRKILFYHRRDPHYGFTNFSSHPVKHKNKTYPTSEHLFQSFKFQDHRPLLAEHIRTCSEFPSMAFSEARRFQPEVRKDWKDVNIEKASDFITIRQVSYSSLQMDETLWLKFTQHQDLKEELLATGSAELVEDSDKDAFWGIGADGKGRNELGKALERLRAKLREPC
ncbi:hypothetical protein NLI96_g6216 [Meripilus lineatus]|uniref:NADAR domain-containing protein n=1 Tax=Meripilus lineatus TaxID=2056292 RepID=A0AAD5YIA1_9APHY|nr:hypothetical protein NLI96_g6216 [Physisporinus lineatus]